MGLKLVHLKIFALGIIVGAALVGCVGFTFPFKWYFPSDDVSYSHGKLLAKNPADDLEFSTCQPRPEVHRPCVVLKADDFYRWKQDYEDTLSALKRCEQAAQVDAGG